MLKNKIHKHSNWSVVYLILGCSLVWFIGIFLTFGFDEASIRINIRWSARISLICFCLAFGASAFNLLFQNDFSKWLIKHRKYLGISFAIIHLVHLLFLILLHQNFQQIFIVQSAFEIALGGLAYLFLTLMLLTSFERCSKLIARTSWERLHKIGGYWILIVFTNSMVGRVITGKMEYLPFGILVLGLWLLRFITWRRKA